MTVVLVSANSIFLFVSSCLFGREYMNDRRKAKHKRLTGVVSIKKQRSIVVQKETKNPTKVLPISELTEDGAELREWKVTE